MRIALVTELFHPKVDDATGVVKQVADRLVDTGHEVQLVTRGPGLSSYRGSRVVRIAAGAPGRTSVGGQVGAALAAFGPDLVHVTSPGKVGRKSLKHARRLGVPTVVTQQSAVDPVEAERWCRTVGRRADHVVTTCRSQSAWLAELGTEAPVWVPGVDTTAWAPSLRDERLHATWARKRSRSGPLVVVGFVGDLRKREGVRRLVEVAEVPGVRLVAIGDGPQRRWLAGKVPGARILSGIEPGDRAVALASLDILVHPGLEQTSCHVLREAAASAVPVVAPAAGGVPDVVRHQRTGLLYDAADPRSLRLAVASLVGDANRRARLGDRARDAVTGRTWAEAVDDLVAVHYAQALVRGHAVSPAA